MSKNDAYYSSPPLRRTHEEMREIAGKTTGENYCCNHKPLHNIILDELHLMLRVTDILIENLIEDAMQWDDKEGCLSAKK